MCKISKYSLSVRVFAYVKLRNCAFVLNRVDNAECLYCVELNTRVSERVKNACKRGIQSKTCTARKRFDFFVILASKRTYIDWK